MTRALFMFFARPLQMAAGALAAEAAAVSLLTLGASPAWVPYTVALVVTVLVPGPVLSVESIGNWARSWPVPESTLLWMSVVPAWLAAWSPVVGAEIGATILWVGGTLAPAEWIKFTFHALLVFGAVPLFSVLLHRRGTTLMIAVGVLVPFVIAYWFAGESPDVALKATAIADLAPAALVAALGCGLAAILTPACLLRAHAEDLEPHRSMQPYDAPARPGRRASPSAVAGGLEKRARRVFGLARYFYAHPAERTAWLNWALLLAALPLARYGFRTFVWILVVTSWPSAYLGVVKPGPLPPHLPVPRERWLAYALLPLFASALLASAIEYTFSPAEKAFGVLTYRAERSAQASGGSAERPRHVTVPIFAWRASWGPAPSIDAGQGASRPLDGHVVVPGLPLHVYNPYAARLDEERGFVNQQVSRALSEFLSKNVSPDEVERACAPFRGSSERFPARCLRIALAAPYRPSLAYSLVRLVILATFVWGFVALHLSIRGHGKTSYRLLQVALLGSLLAAFGVAQVFDSMDERDPTGFSAPLFSLGVLVAELVRVAERVPAITAAIALAAVWVIFWDLARRFRRTELSSRGW